MMSIGVFLVGSVKKNPDYLHYINVKRDIGHVMELKVILRF